MPHRMDIELTSARDDGTFTWRAAGARQPKGAVATTLLPEGSKVGDVVRIEAEVELDGITVLAVVPSKDKVAPSGRIEVVGTKEPVSGVTTVLAGPVGKRRENRFFSDGAERKPGRPGSAGGPRRAGQGPADSRSRPAGDAGAPRADGDRDRRPATRRERPEESPAVASRPGTGEAASDRHEAASDQHQGAGPRGPATPRGDSRGPRPDGGSSSRPGGSPRRESGPRAGGPGRPGDRAAHVPPRRGPVRLDAGTKHRDELMATLPPEQQLIAERLASGGLPAVRKAIAEEQERAKAEGRPPVAGDSILELAEGLQPAVKAAVWMDRAEAAAAHLDDLGLRDLRATVVAAAPRDDAGRDLERTLREGLERRVTKLRTDWEEHLTEALTDGRVLQALRLSARPPEPTARFPAGLIERLTSQVGPAMSAETSPERWLALLDAAVACPVRRQIKPAGIPEDATGEVQRKAREAAGRIPALAPMLGMAMPPPPKPVAGDRVGRPFPIRPPRPRRPPRPDRPSPRTTDGAGDGEATRVSPVMTPATPAMSVAPVAPAQPVPVEPVQPVAPAASVAPTQPGVSDVPVEPIQPGVPDVPVEPIQPVAPAPPVAPAQPIEPPAPAQPAGPVAPASPVDPPEPVLPADAPEPVVPVAPTLSAEPVDVDPVAPALSAEPVDPVEPIDPVVSAELVAPVVSADPGEPVVSAELVAPVVSTDPGEPVVSTDPGEPVVSAELVAPVVSTDPVEALDPDEPENAAEETMVVEPGSKPVDQI